MMLLEWLRSRRRPEPVAAAEIRRELETLTQQRSVTIQQRDLLALDAVDDEAAAARWHHLDVTARQLAQRMEVLAAALPAAEAREAEIARRAEEEALAQRMLDYEQRWQEAQQFLDAEIAALPTGERLTRARDLSHALRRDATVLQRSSKNVRVRRPLDPLDELVSAMRHRIARVERARHAPSHPITLGGRSPEEIAQAAARVQALEERMQAR